MTQVAQDMRGALAMDRGSLPFVDLRNNGEASDGQAVSPFDVVAGVAPPVREAQRDQAADAAEPDNEPAAEGTPARVREPRSPGSDSDT